MYILGKMVLDKNGRLNVAGLFKKRTVALDEVALIFDTETKCLLIEDAGNPFILDDPDWIEAPTRKLDSKWRICLPKWMREEFGDEFFIVGGQHRKIGQALLPRKYYENLVC